MAIALCWRRRRARLAPPSHRDVFGDALTFLEQPSGHWVFPAWLVVSSFVGLVLPVTLGDCLDWFQRPAGVVTSINYTVFVPALAAAYVFLSSRFQSFCATNCLAYDSAGRWRTAIRAVMLFIPLAVIWFAVDAVLVADSETPWTDGRGLTVSGVVYYVLRGINGYLAVGLWATSMAVYWVCGRYGPRGEYQVFDDELRPTPEARHLVLALSLCLLFGPLVTVTHGVGTFLEPTRVGPRELLASTWLGWAIATLMATYFAAMAILALKERGSNEIDAAFVGALARGERNHERFQTEALTKRIALRSLVPARSTALVYWSVVLQVVNVALPWIRE